MPSPRGVACLCITIPLWYYTLLELAFWPLEAKGLIFLLDFI